MDFSWKEVAPGVRHIGDHQGNFCTLLTGSRGAVLFDTMVGLGDLKGFVGTLCPMEPTVIVSHGHFDHVGGARQFPRVLIHPVDLPLLEVGRGQIPVLEQTLGRDLSGMEESFRPERYQPIRPGQVLELGGMTVEVVGLSGHTPGSIGLLCRELRLLLAGDAISPQACILFPESLPLEHYAAMLERAETLPFDQFLSAHFDLVFPKRMIQNFSRCVSLVGKKRGIEYAFGPLPYIKGRAYVGEVRNPETGQPVCLITKPDAAGISGPDGGNRHDQ